MTWQGFQRYLVPGTDARKQGLWVVGGGWTLIGAGESYPPGRHPSGHAFTWERGRSLTGECQVILLTRGRGTFHGAGQPERPVGAGDLLWLLPGRWHRYRPDSASGWDEHWLAVSGPLIDAWLAAGAVDPDTPVWRVGPDRALGAAFREALQLLARPTNATAARLMAAWWCIAAQAAAARDDANGDGADLARILAQHLDTHLDRPLALAALAGRHDLSERHLRRLFARHHGLSPQAYLSTARLDQARRLLLGTDLPIKEVARDCGFASVPLFTRAVARRWGRTPAALRREG
jgi:AraC-like DNA-binding protein